MPDVMVFGKDFYFEVLAHHADVEGDPVKHPSETFSDVASRSEDSSHPRSRISNVRLPMFAQQFVLCHLLGPWRATGGVGHLL